MLHTAAIVGSFKWRGLQDSTSSHQQIILVMSYKSTFVILAIIASSLQACVSTQVSQPAAWLSNDKLFAAAPAIKGLTMVGICATADKDMYLKATAQLQERLMSRGVATNMQYFTDADNRESARGKLGSDVKEFILFLQPIKGVNGVDELNNPMLQKQLEFIIETKAGEKIAAGLISIDRETSANKLASTVAGIIVDYLRKQKMTG